MAGGESRGQRLTLEELHDEEVHVVVLSDVIQRADVRMRQRGNGTRLTREPSAHLFVERDGTREHLDGDATVQTGVGRAEHFAHAACAERTLDAKRAEEAAWGTLEPLIEETTCKRPDRLINND